MAKISINEVTIDGVEYRKVNEDARVGDYVAFAKAPYSYLTAGKMYEVIRIDSWGDPQITDDDGDEIDLYGESYDVFRKVPKQYREVTRPAKVGERIRIVNPIMACGAYGIGDEFVVSDVDSDGVVLVPEARAVGNKHEIIVYDEYVVLEPATEAEYNEYVRKETERRKWAEIGRKPGEYKEGDIVKLAKIRGPHGLEGTTGVITEIDEVENAHHLMYHVVRPEGVGVSGFDTWTKSEEIAELICPVEKRFDKE